MAFLRSRLPVENGSGLSFYLLIDAEKNHRSVIEAFTHDPRLAYVLSALCRPHENFAV